MAVYLTKSMLSKFNRLSYPATSNVNENNVGDDHWHKLSIIKNVQLSKDRICRVCGKNGHTPLTDKIIGVEIIAAIKTVANVTIELDDSLPKFICGECVELLKTAITFKSLCETSDRKFKNITNPMANPAFYSYPYSKHDFSLILHRMKAKREKIAQEKELERRLREKLMEKNNMPRVKQFQCSPCDLSFTNKADLLNHRRERQCMRRACDICGQLVVSIKQHMRQIHKQSAPHKCATCGKEFPVLARLKNHMLVHTNTFNFFCDLCPYKSKHKYYLVLHMRTHTGEKPCKCTHCPATFVNPSNLNKHKLIHQEKQFKCALCEKTFRSNTALREHHDAAHMNIKHSCNFCGRDFSYKSDLRKHEIRSHNRLKRDYTGGEPAYKQAERLQNVAYTITEIPLPQAEARRYSLAERPERPQKEEADDKWRTTYTITEVPISQSMPLLHASYAIDQKEYIQTNHALYFPDVNLIQTSQPVQPQTVELALPELSLKKDDVKLYESQQTIAYF